MNIPMMRENENTIAYETENCPSARAAEVDEEYELMGEEQELLLVGSAIRHLQYALEPKIHSEQEIIAIKIRHY